MTVYETPNEPTGLVYDAQGNKWRKDENYRFECSYPGHTGLRVWPAIGYAEADGARHIRYKKKGQTHD